MGILSLESRDGSGTTSADAKMAPAVVVSETPEDVSETISPDAKGNIYDKRDMKRLGKKQEMRRNFRKFSTLSFTCVIMATFEVLLIANYQGLQNGGRGGFFWSYVWTFVGFAPIIASLAEMSSM
jgi:choline transport protein